MPPSRPPAHAAQAKAGLKFERVGAPQPGDMAQVAGERALEAVAAVDASVLPFFRAAAARLLESVGSAEDALAMALAKLTGHVELRPRSLLTAHEDFTTLQFVSPWPVEKPGQVGAAMAAAGAEDGRWRCCGVCCGAAPRPRSCCLYPAAPACPPAPPAALAPLTAAGLWLPAQAHPRRGHGGGGEAHDADRRRQRRRL